MHAHQRFIVILWTATSCTIAPAVGAAENPPVDFGRQIRPILSNNCFKCHGPDSTTREADLRLDVRESAMADRGGYAVVVPGSAASSSLYERISSTDPDLHMPPADSDKELTTEEIELLKRWVDQGAAWQEHWAFIPPQRPEMPKVKHHSWPRNPIDHFILARLEAEGLSPSPEADRRSLIRRVTFDLTGLPPALSDVEAFVRDQRVNAYEKLVDRLLQSDHYGEHMARFWLDAARYGDTHGLHLDNYREMWPYRDWVIDAFNANMPFDQFTLEQLAGDLLPGSTMQQKVASGFNRCHVTTNEGGSIAEECFVRNVVDRVSTTGTVFLGLTVGCAVCHDHKFDPISQKEFYQLFAFFNNLDGNPMDGNRKDPAPVIKVPTAEESAQLAGYDAEIAVLDAKLRGPLRVVDQTQLAWESRLRARSATEIEWNIVDAEHFSSQGGSTLEKLEDRSILASGEIPAKDVYEIVAHVKQSGLTAVRLEGLTHKTLTEQGAGRSSNSNVVLTGFEAEIAPLDRPDDFRPVKFVEAWADYEQTNGDFKVANAIDGKPETGWATAGFKKREDRVAVFLADEPFGFEQGSVLRIRLRHESKFTQHQFGRFRISLTSAAEIPQIGPRIVLSDWYSLGPFEVSRTIRAYGSNHGPEGRPVDLTKTYKSGEVTLKWTRQPRWTDGKVHSDLPGDVSATYLYRKITTSGAQKVTLSFGSNDAIKVWVNKKQVLAHEVHREAAADQELLEVDLEPGDNELLVKIANFGGSQAFYFVAKSEVAVPPSVFNVVRIDPDKRNSEQQNTVRSYYRNNISTNPELRQLQNSLAEVRTKRTDLDRLIPTTLIMRERSDPREAKILERGQYDRPKTTVERCTPAVLPPMSDALPRDRLGFAKWLLHPEHPLTARVAVNRYWQQYFGVGIVATSEDFGSQGEPPSNPELLDWLAREFVDSGWNVKALQKLIVMSATYRQSSRATPETLAKDRANRLLARGPRFRLDAEMLRDQALALSGLLVGKIGGPSVKPPQPSGLWYAVGYTSSNTAKFSQDTGDKIYRRSLYTFWKRTSPPPQMNTFDAPSREACTVRRERTNTPLQALLLMNDPQYVEAARHFAQRAITEGGTTPPERAAFAFTIATGRPPSKNDLDDLLQVYQDHREHYLKNAQAAAKLVRVGDTVPDESMDTVELAAWTMVANLILNLDEVVTKG